MNDIIAIIPARGGSKGIHKKNIRILDGKPLIQYQIEAALNSKYLDKVYISTDNDDIASVVRLIDGTEIIKRPEEISGDLSKSEEALIHAIKYLESQNISVSTVVFLQATSPLNRPEYIDACIEKILNGYDSVFCAIEDYSFFHNEKALLERPMRQYKIPKIRETGNCWVTKKEILLNMNNRLGGKTGYIIIDPQDAFEIDEPEDLTIIKPFIKRRNRQLYNSYYQQRKPEQPVSYEKGYWGKTKDPDGNQRNKLEERSQFIEDANEVIKYINEQPPGKILDIGCGFGFLLSAVNNNWDKHGTEISYYAANIASNYANIFTGELEDTDYLPESFDVIVLYHVIEHLVDPVRYIKKIYSLIKIGGKLIIATPDFSCITAQRFKEKFRLLHDNTHISLFSTESLINLIEDYGFEKEHISYPYFETRHFTVENLERLFDTSKVSPPFYGNIIHLYAYKC
jgi:CMP-N-acetylneuraminic acid synthetase/2-polyprenyl-3-methyl-5-hydroxy-6-metoxy-1,4-benzoquinol methylase